MLESAMSRLAAQTRLFTAIVVVVAVTTGGCGPREASSTPTVTQAWEQRREHKQAARSPNRQAVETNPGAADAFLEAAPPIGGPVAVVNGTPLDRNQFVSLLFRSRGAAVLEQLVGLAAAENYATAQGIAISDADVDFEYDLALRRLVDPLALTISSDFDRAGAERLLDAVLAERMMSRPEYMLTVRRNAYLRKIAAVGLTIADDQLKAEFDLVYGDRVQVRHVQLANLADASRIKERLAAGEDFAELASRYSTNATTARRGGLFEPFSLRDEDVPLAFRQVAARLRPGEVSDLVRVGEWFHLLKMERLIPAEVREFDDVKGVLRSRLVVRMSEAKMRTLYEKLFREASVQIADPVLRDAFRAAHPELVR